MIFFSKWFTIYLPLLKKAIGRPSKRVHSAGSIWTRPSLCVWLDRKNEETSFCVAWPRKFRIIFWYPVWYQILFVPISNIPDWCRSAVWDWLGLLWCRPEAPRRWFLGQAVTPAEGNRKHAPAIGGMRGLIRLVRAVVDGGGNAWAHQGCAYTSFPVSLVLSMWAVWSNRSRAYFVWVLRQ